MIRLLQMKWTALAIGTLAYVVVTWLFLQPSQQLQVAARELHDAQVSAEGINTTGPSWAFQNPEMTQLIAELKEERATLKEKERQLGELQTRLLAERQEIYSTTQTVYQLQTNFNSMVTHVTETEAANLKKLAKVYAAMSPEGATRILKEMDDDQVVKILALMKDSETAPILELFSQGTPDAVKRAADISNRLRLTIQDSTLKPSAP